MGLELELVNPISGELVDPRDIPKIADAISNIRVVKQQLNEALELLTQAVIEESRRRGTKTIHVGKTTVQLSTDHEIEWDIEILSELIEEAGLPQDRWEQLVQTIVTYKIDGRVATQVAAANKQYKSIIERAQTKAPKRQYVKLKSF